MKYLLFVACDPDHTEADVAAAPDIDEWLEYVNGKGLRITGDRLRPVSDATTLRVRGGELLVTDGPFAETTEWIAGFDILECEDLDQAIEVAAKHPMAYTGRLELRPFWPLDDE
ncbi:transcription initiation protein [Jiangella aurantiaca]|uniref:Transcription initiation protein n=1 Tax=Jiangella aurantiaca TaxID=2530373 RepID=A0A4R5AEV6_9ACTN|nr:YciI family protein [Jiangella aurantiaca]TDD68452.1 transcription initiation protein [Jiangella aurantiaca]